MLAAGSVVSIFAPFFGPFVAVIGVWGLVAGAVIVYSATKLSGSEGRKYSTAGLIFSILALVTMQGFVIGPILSLIGSAMARGEAKK